MNIEPGAAGEVTFTWSVDGDRRPFGAAGEAWLAAVIPEIFRLTGWQAEERVERIVSTGGVEAVLDEIALLEGDHVQAIYLLELLERAPLETEQLERWLDLAGRGLGSDHELGRVLQAVPLDRLSDPAVQERFVEAASSIGSDFGLRRTLEHLLQRDGLSTDLLRPLLRVAGTIGSDFELAELLVAVCQRFPPDRALPEEFYEVASTIGSDYEMRRALAQLSGRPMASGDLARALGLTTAIGSDFELAELLIDLLSQLSDDQALPEEFYQAAGTIGSDHEMRRVLARSIERPLEAESLARVLEVSRQIGSDFELAEFLVALLRRHGDPAEARQAFEAALDTIGSSAERERVRAAWQHAGA